MKKIIVGLAVLGSAASAQAADLAAKAPYMKAPVAVVYDWTGFYFGGNAGIGLGRDVAVHSLPLLPGNEASYLGPQGAAGGVQVGYNWQTHSSPFGSPLVFGIEADIQGTDMHDSFTCLLTCSAALNTRYDQRLDWFGTVRGRLGIATGPVLTYVTAGYAAGGVKTSFSETAGGTTGVFSTNNTRSGWTWGSGVEASLGGNWTGKIEYLYVDLGDRRDLFTLNGAAQRLDTDVREQIFRVGLNYRIGGNGSYVPVVPSNWNGFYLGGNFGSGTGRDRSALAVPAGAPLFTELFNLSPDGYLGGVQAGYNWQAGSWVFGLEGDVQASSERDHRTCVLLCSPLVTANYDARLPWLATARGRLGYSLGSTLFYATGGYAYGGITTKISSTIAPLQEFKDSKGGWTVGGGIETPFSFLGLFGSNWTTKTEYLYVDLGRVNDTLAGGAATSSTQVREHIFRTGLNYHFNSPVVAKY